MKNIVLDGDRIAEAIQKAKDKMINGEYDNNDLILRGDALKAIRQKCISEHLPFKSNTPVGARVLDALAAVYQVKPYKKEESKMTVWHDAQNDPPKENGEYLCYYEYFRYGNYYCMYRTIDRGHFFNGQWGGEPTRETSTKVIKWTELPLPEPPGGDPMTKQQLVDEYAREHLCATCEWKHGNICTLPRCMKLEERSKNERKTAQPR